MIPLLACQNYSLSNYNDKYGNLIKLDNCVDSTSELDPDIMVYAYLEFSSYHKLDFSSFKMAYIKQLLVWNNVSFDVF